MALGAGYRDQGLVFTTPEGDPVHPDRMSQAFARHSKAAGLPPLPLHGLRHSHASTLLEAGVHPKVVQERLGHSSAGFTLQVYSHVTRGMDAEAAEKAAARVFRKQSG
jgi:integrase